MKLIILLTHTLMYYTHLHTHTWQRQLSVAFLLLIADLLTTTFSTIPYCTGRMHHSVVWQVDSSRPQSSAAHKSVWIALNITGMDITKVQHVFVTQCWIPARSVVMVFHSARTLVSIWQTLPKHRVPIPRLSPTDLCTWIVFCQHYNKSISQMDTCFILESTRSHFFLLGDDV